MANYIFRVYMAPVSVEYSYCSYKRAIRDGGPRRIDYVTTCGGEINAESVNEALEKVRHFYNSKDDYQRLLSISDVVTINGIPYYKDVDGWCDISSKTWNGM